MSSLPPVQPPNPRPTGRQEGSQFDFSAWLLRATDFSHRIGTRIPDNLSRRTNAGQVATEDALTKSESELQMPFPEEFRAFLKAGLGGFRRSFCWTPSAEDRARLAPLFGRERYISFGPRFTALRDLSLYLTAASAWAKNYTGWEGAVLKAGLPFIALDNGDFVFMDLRVPQADPPVVFFAHEEGCQTIAPSLTQFLSTWEKLAYIGPEYVMLRRFLGQDGYLDSGSSKAHELRSLLEGNE